VIDPWLTPDGLAQTIIVAGATVTALFVIGRSVRSSYRFARRLELIHTTILAELLPNHGGSIKDKIDDIAARVTRLEQTATKAAPSDV